MASLHRCQVDNDIEAVSLAWLTRNPRATVTVDVDHPEDGWIGSGGTHTQLAAGLRHFGDGHEPMWHSRASGGGREDEDTVGIGEKVLHSLIRPLLPLPLPFPPPSLLSVSSLPLCCLPPPLPPPSTAFPLPAPFPAPLRPPLSPAPPISCLLAPLPSSPALLLIAASLS